MSVDEMSEEIETHLDSYMPVYGLDDDIGKRIVAALRAGEALAAASTNQVIEVLRECGFYTSANDLKRARDTWDAETKGDEG